MLRLPPIIRSFVRDQFTSGLPLLAATIVSSAFSYLAVTLSARILGAADYGLLGTLLGITSLVSVAFRPIHGAATHVGSSVLASGYDGVPAAMSRLLAACLAGVVVVWMGLVLLDAPIHDILRLDDDRWALTLLVLLLGSATYWQGLSGLLFGVQKFAKYSIATVCDAGVRAVVMAPLAPQYGVAGAVGGYLVGSAVANAVAVHGLGGLTWAAPSKVASQHLARVSGDWVLLTAIVACLQNFDLLFLRSYAPVEQVGWYAAVSALANLAFTVSAPLYVPLYPRLVLAYHRGRPTLPLLLGTMVPIVLGGAIVASGTAWLGGEITRLLFGEEFIAGGSLLPILVCKTTALLAFFIIGQYAIALGRAKAVVASAIPAILSLVSLAVLRLPPDRVALVMGLGAGGAALIMAISLVRLHGVVRS
jgi:O-antigen/teichoic acid export membrane protein